MAVLAFIAQHISAANASSYTFSSTSTGGLPDIGAVASDRVVVVGADIAATATAPRLISSTVIGGVTTATSLQTAAQRSATLGTNFNTYTQHMVYCLLTTATTAIVVLTATANAANCGCSIWSATHVGASAATYGTLTTATIGWATATGVAMTAVVNSGGFFAAKSSQTSVITPPTVTWTGATEEHDTTIESTRAHSAADGTVAGTVSVAFSTATTSAGMFIGAMWVAFNDQTPGGAAEFYRKFTAFPGTTVGRRTLRVRPPMREWQPEARL